MVKEDKWLKNEKKRMTKTVMMEILTREVLIEQIKRTIELVKDGSHNDTINSLSDYLILVEKYAEEKGIKVFAVLQKILMNYFFLICAYILISVYCCWVCLV